MLEDYISELSLITLDEPHHRSDTSEICNNLWEILIEEEKRIPDFVVSGDQISLDKSVQIDNVEHNNKEVGEVKKLAWLMATVFIGVVGFFFGFFTAP
jgi:hypothetical protein